MIRSARMDFSRPPISWWEILLAENNKRCYKTSEIFSKLSAMHKGKNSLYNHHQPVSSIFDTFSTDFAGLLPRWKGSTHTCCRVQSISQTELKPNWLPYEQPIRQYLSSSKKFLTTWMRRCSTDRPTIGLFSQLPERTIWDWKGQTP